MNRLLRIGILTLFSVFLLGIFSAAAAGYCLAEKDGCLALWDCAKSQWCEITDVPVASLPEADRAALRSGVFCGSSGEAAARMEDYGG